MKVSVVVPAHNEEENIKQTISSLARVLKENYKNWELILVDDGSSDRTKEIAEKIKARNRSIKIISYQPNRGRGYAIRKGFEAATGDVVVTTDADLSYSPDHIPKLVKALTENPEIDIVVGSPYIRGGKVENVPFFRLFWSKYGNKFLSLIMPGNLTTFTGILRAYRRPVIDSLELQAEDKDIHLEILSKALALGYQVLEVPAVLKTRRKGKSKFKLSTTVISHIIFSLFEKPAFFLGIIGLLFLLLGLVGGVYIIYLWQKAALNPDRPLMTLFSLLIISGIQIFVFSIIATQLVFLRNEVYRVQKEQAIMRKKIEKKEAKNAFSG